MNLANDNFDVFISYSRADTRHAAEIDSVLRAKGLRPFFDRRNLAPGLPWVRALEQAISAAKAAIVLIGPRGLGNTQQYERELALVRQTHDPAFPVVPVILPETSTDRPFDFLGLLTWIDFSQVPKVSDAPRELEHLLTAIRGGPISSDVVQEAICPYRGLDAFREEDSAFFFGRGSADDPKSRIGELVSKVREHPFAMVVGRSGSGKSSLIYAGLLPALRREHDLFWNVLSLRPGPNPLRALAAAFNPRADGEGAAAYADKITKEADKLRTGALELLSHMIREELDRSEGKPDRLLLYIDQWEELYAQAPSGSDTERAAQHAADVHRFIDLLLTAARTAPVAVVGTVRADFYDPLIGHHEIRTLLPTRQVLLGSMSRSELESTIVEPAKKVGLAFDPPSLVQRIVDEVGEDERTLPLLQYALKESWALRKGNTITADSYARSGGVREAIKNTAEQTFSALSGDDQRAARQLFLRLVTPGEGQEDTRARAAMPSDLMQRRIVDQFAGPRTRLLVTGLDRAARPTVEVAHEALIRTWPRLREWIDANRDNMRTRAAVLQAKAEWEQQGRRKDLLLPSGFQLERARALLAEPGDLTIDDIQEFIALSSAREEAEGRKSRNQARRRLALIAAFALFFFGLSLWALHERQAAETQRSVALQARQAAETQRSVAVRRLQEAQIAQSRSLYGVVRARLQAADPLSAVAIALEALPSGAMEPDRPYVPEMELALRLAYRAAQGSKFTPEWNASVPGPIAMATINLSGTVVAAANDKTVTVFDRKSNSNYRLMEFPDSIWAVRFLPDGRLVAASKKLLRVYDFVSQTHILDVQAPTSQVVCGWMIPIRGQQLTPYFMAESIPGNQIHFDLVELSGGRVVITNAHCLAGNEYAFVLQAFEKVGSDRSAIPPFRVFSADPYSLTSFIDQNSILWVWGSNSGVRNVFSLGKITTHTTSPDGAYVAAVSGDGLVTMLESKTLVVAHQFPTSAAPVTNVEFSSDGQRLLAAHRTGSFEIFARGTVQDIARFSGNSIPASVKTSVCKEGAVRSEVVTRDGKSRVRVENNRLSVSSSPNGATLAPDMTIRDVNLSADEEHIVVMAEPSSLPFQKIMLIYDRNTMQLLSKRQFEFGAANQCARVSPDERHTLIVNNDSYRIVDFANGSVVNEIPSRPGGQFIGAEVSPEGHRIAVYNSDGIVTLVHFATGMTIDWINIGTAPGVEPSSFGFDSSGKELFIARLDQNFRWSVFPNFESLVNAARAIIPFCIAPGDRAKYYLSLEPPSWCIRLGKKPYDTDEWKRWADAREGGMEPPMPHSASVTAR